MNEIEEGMVMEVGSFCFLLLIINVVDKLIVVVFEDFVCKIFILKFLYFVEGKEIDCVFVVNVIFIVVLLYIFFLLLVLYDIKRVVVVINMLIIYLFIFIIYLFID